MTKLAPIVLILIMIPVMAHADSMNYTFAAYDSSMTFHIPGQNINTQLGIFTISITDTGAPTSWPGTTFLAFCVDLQHYATQNRTVVLDDMENWQQPYNNPEYPDYVGAGSYAAYMINYFGMPGTLMEQSAMQLAVWEVLYEDRDLKAFNVSSANTSTRGHAYASNVSSTVINQANSYLSVLNSLLGVPDANAPWVKTTDTQCAGYQDFTTPAPAPGPPTTVPEPSTLVLLGVGLLGAGIAARRNSKNRK